MKKKKHKRGKYARSHKRTRKHKYHRPKAKLGSGTRFRTLAEEIKKAARKRGYRISSIGGLLGKIGRAKYGKKRMSAMAKRGKRRRGKR